MFKQQVGMIVNIIVLVFSSVIVGFSIEDRVEALLSTMSLNEMLGQMTQLDISTILNYDRTLNEEKVREHARLKVGSYLNTPAFEDVNVVEDHDAGIVPRNVTTKGATFSASEWRSLMTQIQHVFMNESNGHPVLYGLDSVHGANYIRHATIFSQQINAAATFHPFLVSEMGRITGRDTTAAGIPWVFGPILEIAQNPLWSRTFETFGEDPVLVSVMAKAIIQGIQSNKQISACMKHVIGYSKTPTGHDRDGVTISDFDLLNYFAPPFLSAIQAGAKTAMASYVSINGVPVVANTKILRDLLRHDMNFDGLVVTDWSEINNLHVYHHVASSPLDAVRMALVKTPLDLSMVPFNTSFIDMARMAVNQYPVLHDRIKDSVRRILRLKLELGLYEQPVPGQDNVQHVGSKEDRQIALTIARESIILLQNNQSTLPMSREQSKVFLTGPSMNNIGFLCGGWTLKWQGVSGNLHFPNGISIKHGVEQVTQSVQTYFNGLYVNGSYSYSDLEKAKHMARRSSHTIIALGEGPYAEKPGDINDLALPQGQIEYVREIASTGTKIVIILVSGRPRLLGDLPSLAHAILYTMLPCEMGGQAVAEILYGIVNPSGRLPITYPRDAASIAIPYNHRVTTQCGDQGVCPIQWSFGYGLSYTSFSYSNLYVSKTIVTENQAIDISITVKNTGLMDGMETVMLFITQLYRDISVPEVKQLRAFNKIFLRVGESQVVTFTLSKDDWSVYEPQIGKGFKRVVQSGPFILAIQPETTCDGSQQSMCATILVT